MISVDEIIRFQAQVIEPTAKYSKYSQLLELPQWMGLSGAGVRWQDMPQNEAQALADLLGPAALKVVRVSPRLLEVLKTQKPIVVAGGSCLITTADAHKVLGNGHNIGHEKLIGMLPNLPQAVDAMLPITCADIHLDILEDSLFSEGRPELLASFQAQGKRHLNTVEKLLRLLRINTKIAPCFFSSVRAKEKTEEFFYSDALRGLGHMSAGISRNQVLWSFTGHWADTLREFGVIPEDSIYIVNEPFHHFTEAMNLINNKVGGDTWRSNMVAKRFFERYPYGEGPNAGVQGAICFMPYMQPDGNLGFAKTTTLETCNQTNAQEFLAKREQLLLDKKFCSLYDDWLYADGINCLYFIPECRQALFDISEFWKNTNEEIEKRKQALGRAPKSERKAINHEFRESDELRKLWQPSHELLFEHLCMFINSLFSS
ncbi:MAG: hypothetical protein ABIH21_03605 [Patescibacteria group bacterium]